MSRQPLLQETPAACRICQAEGTAAEPLLSPCLCEGSIRWVHVSCLDAWRCRGDECKSCSVRCELCGFYFRYELRRADWLEVLRDLISESMTSSAPMFLLLGIWVGASFSSLWLSLEVIFALLGSRAVLDIGLTLKGCWHRSGVANQSDTALLGAIKCLQIAFRSRSTRCDMTKEAAAESEDFAQGRASAVAEALAESGQLSAIRDANVEDDLGADVEEPFTFRELCCSASCCAQALLFLAIPPLLAFAWRILIMSLGMSGLCLLGKLLAGLGVVYWPGIAAAHLIAAAKEPPLRALRAQGLQGLPLVRSLSDEERCRAKSARPQGFRDLSSRS
eukprot:TRINITY_DN96906_c0_g1_i1.p1 TRINITY_DN96906_c0_g1~~TRINITY_DN96906_c0_g1_i1.p1  ORF type:complete len:334 (+),score=54.51 TRINITY_DN96906_c0_g1_i1:117-1118(+)